MRPGRAGVPARPGRTVADAGEDGLLRRIARILDPPPRGTVGIGDDAAVVRGLRMPVLLTTDSLVEGTHFHRLWFRPEEVGRKAMAANLSDVAAMGGKPTHALVSLVLPADTAVAAVERLYRGIRREARAAGIPVVGGNLAGGAAIAVTVTLVGTFPGGKKPLLRSGARPGDRILVSGQPGLAYLGFRLLDSERPAGFVPGGDPWNPPPSSELAWRARLARRSPWARRALRRFLLPEARTALAVALRRHRPRAMMDVSDGLGRDLRRLAAAGTGIRIDPASLPLPPGFVRLAATLGEDPVRAQRTGGEDYELLAVLPPSAASRLEPKVAGVDLTEVGEAVRGAGVRGWNGSVNPDEHKHF